MKKQKRLPRGIDHVILSDRRESKDLSPLGLDSALRLLRKLQEIFLSLLIVFLPSNLGLHFELPSSYVLGYLVPYFVPTLYLTDLFLLGLLSFWGLELCLDREQRQYLWEKLKNDKLVWTLLLFLIMALPNVSVVNKLASWWLWTLLLKGSFLFVYVRETSFGLTQKKVLTLVFSLMLLFQSVFAITQFVTQKPLFAYRYFGETSIDSSVRGIAQVNLGGQKLIRSYGTSPHPNVLGGILVIALLVLVINWSAIKTSQEKMWRWLTVVMGLVSLFLTFSRSAWLALFLSFIWIFRCRTKRLGGMFPFLFAGMTLQSPSIQERVELAKISLSVIGKEPLFGVGLGNFLISLQEQGGLWGDYRFLQPVHNVFLLLLAEVGLIGFLIFGLFIYQVFQLAWKKGGEASPYIPLLIAVLTIGMFDHYLLTLQQGVLLLFLCLGTASSQKIE